MVCMLIIQMHTLSYTLNSPVPKYLGSIFFVILIDNACLRKSDYDSGELR